MASYSRHYQQGDEMPPITAGKLRIYMMNFCPFSQRARLLLEKHNVNYERVNINLDNKPDWFLEKSKGGTVPVLEIDGKLIPGSLIAAEYVDEVYAADGKRAVASDAFERAKQKVLIESFGKVIGNFYSLAKEIESSPEHFYESLDAFQQELKCKSYFAGNDVGWVDYMVWPWFERMGSWVGDIPATRFPNLMKWIVKMKQDTAVSKIMYPPGLLKKFFDGVLKKNAKYDEIE